MTAVEKRNLDRLDDSVTRAVQRLVGGGLLTTDPELLITGWSRWLESSSGLGAADVVGRQLFEVYPELVERGLDRCFHQALEGQVILLAHRRHKYLLPMPGSDPRLPRMPQSARIGPLVENGEITGTLTIVEDVTEQALGDEELAAADRKQAVIAAIGQRALTADDVDEAIRMAVQALTDTLAGDTGALLEFAEGGKQFSLRAGYHWPEELSFPLDGDNPDGDNPDGDNPDGDNPDGDNPDGDNPDSGNADTQRWLADLRAEGSNASESGRRAPPFLRKLGFKSGLSAPLDCGGKPLGVLIVAARRPDAFATESGAFLQSIAHVLCAATERRALESALRERLDDLASVDLRKNEFLAMLAHELRNPLAPIVSGIELLRMIRCDDEESRMTIDIIDRQTQQLARLIDDLLDVARITHGAIKLRAEPVELSAVVERAIETSRPWIDARRHALTVEIDSRPMPLQADETRLAQAIANLLNNAAKYTPEGGRIALVARRENAHAVVSVVDTGVGVSAAMLPKIFGLFTQGDRPLDRSQGGLGIGLTVVRSLIEMHGGHVTAHSEGEGRGSKFIVELPLRPAGVSNPSEPQPSTTEAGQRPRRILVLDDNVDGANVLGMLLRTLGHAVSLAYDGPAALEVAEAWRPDVVLLDIGLPDIDGLEVARRLRQSPNSRGAALVALTGFGQERDRRRAAEAGFSYHLVKPATLESLRQMFETI